MSEIKAEEAAERFMECFKPGKLSEMPFLITQPNLKARIVELEAERESLLKYKEAFEAMVDLGLSGYPNRKGGFTCIRENDYRTWEGATPLEAVMAAKKGLEGKG